MRSCFADAIRDFWTDYKNVISRKQRNDIEHQRNGIKARFNKLIEDENKTIAKFEENIKICDVLISEGYGDSTYDYFGDGSKGTLEEKKANLVRVLPARRGQLKRLEEDRDLKLAELDTVKDPSISEKLMMLNLIKVI